MAAEVVVVAIKTEKNKALAALTSAAISLPGMNGMELLRELRNRGIPAPTILISDDSDIPTAVDAIRAGAADFIERPFIDRVLLRRVQSALEISDAA